MIFLVFRCVQASVWEGVPVWPSIRSFVCISACPLVRPLPIQFSQFGRISLPARGFYRICSSFVHSLFIVSFFPCQIEYERREAEYIEVDNQQKKTLDVIEQEIEKLQVLNWGGGSGAISCICKLMSNFMQWFCFHLFRPRSANVKHWSGNWCRKGPKSPN